jgi:hypothetical protein
VTIRAAERTTVFRACPQSKDSSPQTISLTHRHAAEVGCTGMLIYAEKSIVDLWLVAQAC